MYVCICFGVTDTRVDAEIAGGARSMRDIAASCRAGTDCGRCVKRISGMIPREGVRQRGGDCAAACATPCAPGAGEEAAAPVPAVAAEAPARPARPSAPATGGAMPVGIAAVA